MLAVSSPAVAILANAATFLASAVLVAAIPAGPAFRPARPTRAAARLLSELRDGVDALRGAPAAVRVIAADAICSAVYGILTVTLVLVAGRVGAGAGRLRAAARRVRRRRRGRRGVAGRIDGGHWRRTLAVGARARGAAGRRARRRRLAVDRARAGVVGGTGAVVAEVLSETALPRMLDDAVLARAYGIMLPAHARPGSSPAR